MSTPSPGEVIGNALRTALGTPQERKREFLSTLQKIAAEAQEKAGVADGDDLHKSMLDALRRPLPMQFFLAR